MSKWKDGMKLKCTYSEENDIFTVGKVYTVHKYVDDRLIIRSNADFCPYYESDFEKIDTVKLEEVKPMKIYTEQDIHEGTVLTVVDDKGRMYWTIGKDYLVKRDSNGDLYVNTDYPAFRSYLQSILLRLNNANNNDYEDATFKIVRQPEQNRDLNKLSFSDLQEYVRLQSELEDSKCELEYHETLAEELKQAVENIKVDIQELFRGGKQKMKKEYVVTGKTTLGKHFNDVVIAKNSHEAIEQWLTDWSHEVDSLSYGFSEIKATPLNTIEELEDDLKSAERLNSVLLVSLIIVTILSLF